MASDPTDKLNAALREVIEAFSTEVLAPRREELFRRISASLAATARGAVPRVLYIEDDERNVEVMQFRLGKRFDVLVASNDVGAVELYRKHGDTLDAVMIDVELKGSLMDGVQLTRLFRGTLSVAETPDFAKGVEATTRPIVAVTAYSVRFTKGTLNAAGAEEYFTKPLDFTKLTRVLTAMTGLGAPAHPVRV